MAILTHSTPLPTPASLAARDRVITQTLVRQSTTFITYVTLGGAPPNPDPQPAPPPPPPPPPSTSRAPTIYGSDGSLTSAQIGAILGSVIAFVALVLVGWFCLTGIRRFADDASSDDESVVYVRRGRGGGSSDTSSESDRSRDPWARRGPPARGPARGPARAPPGRPMARQPARPGRVQPMQVNYHPTPRPVYSNLPRTARG
jgi:hypothetical protein